MIAGNKIPDVPELIDSSSIHVRAPTLVVFLCGGEINAKAEKPPSLREAFLRVLSKTPLADFHIVLAEEVAAFLPNGEYVELLRFESDIAQISELLVLFSESPGSFAEMGVFVVDDEVAPKMMVVIDDKNFDSDTFIKLGPLFSLKRAFGNETVCVLGLDDLGLQSVRLVANINLEKFAAALVGPLAHRINAKREPSTFNQYRNGHVTKLITGLVQHYAALTQPEIDTLLYCLNVKVAYPDIKKHLLCAKAFNWITEVSRGIETYYVARVSDPVAFNFRTRAIFGKVDRTRWRTDILEHWRQEDAARFSVIKKVASGSIK